MKDSAAWPLSSLRQSFLNGSLTRLLDTDTTLKAKIVEFVSRGDFGLASGQSRDGSFERVWFEELVAPEEVAFDADVFLLSKKKVRSLKTGPPEPPPEPPLPPGPPEPPGQPRSPEPPIQALLRKIRVSGAIPPEVWNRLGTKLIPKLRGKDDLRVGIEFSLKVRGEDAAVLLADLRAILEDLGLSDSLRVEE